MYGSRQMSGSAGRWCPVISEREWSNGGGQPARRAAAEMRRGIGCLLWHSSSLKLFSWVSGNRTFLFKRVILLCRTECGIYGTFRLMIGCRRLLTMSRLFGSQGNMSLHIRDFGLPALFVPPLVSLTMAPRLRMPFPSLSADNFLSRGAAGHVFQISPNIVFKCPTQFTDPFPQQAEEIEESVKKIEAESPSTESS